MENLKLIWLLLQVVVSGSVFISTKLAHGVIALFYGKNVLSGTNSDFLYHLNITIHCANYYSPSSGIQSMVRIIFALNPSFCFYHSTLPGHIPPKAQVERIILNIFCCTSAASEILRSSYFHIVRYLIKWRWSIITISWFNSRRNLFSKVNNNNNKKRKCDNKS